MYNAALDNTVKVYKGRTTILPVSLGIDVSQDTITSEIRTNDSDRDLIVSWDVAFLTDGTDGELLFTLPKSKLDNVAETRGVMDFKRISNGVPLHPISQLDVQILLAVTE